jgi:hypothetical protein
MALIKITAVEASVQLWHVMQKGLTPFLTSSPGLGKSSIAKQIAAKHNLKVLDLRLSQCDTVDLNGFPQINNGKASYVPMDTFPMETDPLATEIRVDSFGVEYTHTFDGWLLLLDEINSAAKAVQAAAYKLVLDHEVGLHAMHPKVYKMAAGNLKSDGAIVNDLSTAMQSRMIHFELALDHQAWIDWATKAGIDFRVIAYMNWKPEKLQAFDPNHSDRTFPCPRTWEFVSRLIKGDAVLTRADHLAMLAGTVGEGTGMEFLGFSSIFQSLPTIQQIIASPLTFTLPTAPDVKYAIAGLIANHFDTSNASALVEAISRLDIEFQIITLQSVVKNNRKLIGNPDVKKWTMANAPYLI